jgi:phosphoribosylformimino-5-aminoimidazole carboxamide ribonucleotide (ProFAR) isomerase
MAQVARHPIIASGGIAALDDLKRLATLEPTIVIGALVGKALYEGRFSLKEAIAASR